jgi:electron transfer flavoprotein beta subunit
MKEPLIIVCIKPVPDPECPASSLEIDSENLRINPIGVPPVINPYDENALEAALQIKDRTGAKVIALTMVEKSPGGVLHKARTGADETYILQDESFKDLDAFSTARILSTAIMKIGGYDIIITGRQSADWSFGLTGSFIAGILDIPSVTVAKNLRIDGDDLFVERLKRSGSEIVRTSMPALITMSGEIGDLRLFPLKAINDARKKPQTIWSAADLTVDPDSIRKRSLVRLSPPPSSKRDCVFITGQNAEEKGEELAVTLRQNKVL